VPLNKAEMPADSKSKTRCARLLCRALANLAVMVSIAIVSPHLCRAQSVPSPATSCQITSTNFEGWKAQQITNHCVKLIIVPQLGGRVMQVTFAEGRPYYSTGVRRARNAKREKTLLAFSLNTETFEWRYPQIGQGDFSGGTMATASGLVFFGDDAESFEAVDAKTGAPLWHFTTGQRFHSSPMSYAVLGKQYIAIALGSDILSFALP
jgi:outer membrane protein assembly factor BamB